MGPSTWKEHSDEHFFFHGSLFRSGLLATDIRCDLLIQYFWWLALCVLPLWWVFYTLQKFCYKRLRYSQKVNYLHFVYVYTFIDYVYNLIWTFLKHNLIVGVCGLIWGICWQNFSCNSPDEHPKISKQELKLIKLTVRPVSLLYLVTYLIIFCHYFIKWFL